MADLLLSLVTLKDMLVANSLYLTALGAGILYYSYRKALSVLVVLGTLILGIGAGSLLFKLISSLLS